MDSDGITDLLKKLGVEPQTIFKEILLRYTTPFLVIKTSTKPYEIKIAPNFDVPIHFSHKAVARMWHNQKKQLANNQYFLIQALTEEILATNACTEIKKLATPETLTQVCDSIKQETSCSITTSQNQKMWVS